VKTLQASGKGEDMNSKFGLCVFTKILTVFALVGVGVTGARIGVGSEIGAMVGFFVGELVGESQASTGAKVGFFVGKGVGAVVGIAATGQKARLVSFLSLCRRLEYLEIL